MRLAPYIVFRYILLGKISHVYEIDSSHIIAESEQIDGQSDIVDDPKYFRFADSTFSGRSVQFRLERVVFRLGNLSLNSDIIYNRNVRKRRPIVFSENSCPRNHDS